MGKQSWDLELGNTYRKHGFARNQLRQNTPRAPHVDAAWFDKKEVTCQSRRPCVYLVLGR
jgi:hypothetical protein